MWEPFGLRLEPLNYKTSQRIRFWDALGRGLQQYKLGETPNLTIGMELASVLFSDCAADIECYSRAMSELDREFEDNSGSSVAWHGRCRECSLVAMTRFSTWKRSAACVI